jgi:hypothetical protein
MSQGFCDICFNDNKLLARLGCACKTLNVCSDCNERQYGEKLIPVCSVCKRIDTKRNYKKLQEQERKILNWNDRFFVRWIPACIRQKYMFWYINHHIKDFLDVHHNLLEELCDLKEEIVIVSEHVVGHRRFRIEYGVTNHLNTVKKFPIYWKSSGVFTGYITIKKL